MEYQYFEVEFSIDHDENTAEWICIRGERQPSVEEANVFCKADAERVKMPVTGVFPISRQEAEAFYDFTNEANGPYSDDRRSRLGRETV